MRRTPSPLPPDRRRRLGLAALLHHLQACPAPLRVGLLEGDDEALEPLLDRAMAEDLLQVSADGLWSFTSRGRRTYTMMLRCQQSYLAHLDLYAAVDLAAGTFGDNTQGAAYGAEYSDLRVAVAEYKRVDPYRMVFLAMLSEGAFLQGAGWQFELALGEDCFNLLEQTVRTQLNMEQLGYRDGKEVISGEAVLVDVILQGAQENLRRLNAERKQREAAEAEAEQIAWEEEQAALEEEEEEEELAAAPRKRAKPDRPAATNGAGEPADAEEAYDPWAEMQSYLSDPRHIERFWGDDNW